MQLLYTNNTVVWKCVAETITDMRRKVWSTKDVNNMAVYFLRFQDWLQIFAPNGSHEKERPKAIIVVQYDWFNIFWFSVFI